MGRPGDNIMKIDTWLPFGRRRFIAALFAAAALATGLNGCGDNDGLRPGAFYASWTGSLSDATQSLPGATAPAPQAFSNQTVRHVLRLSLGGEAIRIKVSNLFGREPITFSSVHVARSTGASSIDVGTDRPVTFAGQASTTVPAGAEVMSDAIPLAVASLSNIAVSMYFATPTTVATVHALGRQTAYVGVGDQSSAASIPAAGTSQLQSYYGITVVEALIRDRARVVVTFGDSITDGFNSTVDAAKRYPNQLDDRLKAAGFARTGVVNAGISGNRWLNDVAGPNGNGRFERDVLAVAGVTHTIILLGINDIGFASIVPAQTVSEEQITTSMAAAITKAKAKRVKVYVATLLPFKGAGYYSTAGEAKRQAVNAFIRTNRDIDGVIDFDKVMQSSTDPLAMNPAYDSGDHLHPNDAGYGAMAAAIDLQKLE
jgi:lysophospholipase L1-like esterase